MSDKPVKTTDIESESRLMATAILDPKRLEELEREFPTTLFSHPPAQAVFATALQMRKAGEPVDPATVGTAIRHQQEGDFMHSCMSVIIAEPIKDSFEHYKDRVRDSIGRRVTISKGEALVAAAADPLNKEWQDLAKSIATGLPGAGTTNLKKSATVDLAEFASVQPHEAITLLPASGWKGMQREGTVSFLGAASKTGKSWFQLAKVQHAVLGKPFLGREMLPPSTGHLRKALILDFELPKSVFMSRWVALSGCFEEDERQVLFDPGRVCIECHRGNMKRPVDWIEYCCGRIAEYCGPGDIASVDCLQPIMGDQDANLSHVVRPIVARFQAATTKSGAMLDIVDHYNKGGEGAGMHRLSGSVAKSAGPDSIITLNGSQDGTIIVTADLRMDPPVDDFHVQFEGYQFRVVTAEEMEERRKSIQAEKEAQQLHEMFPDGQWYGVKELATRIGISKTAMANRLEKHRDRLEVKQDGTANLYKFANNREPEQ